MHENIWLNDKLVTASDALIAGVSSAGFYGKGIFTSIAIYKQTPFLWEKHWRRLQQNALTVRIDISEFNEQFVREALDKVIDKNRLQDGRARITFFDQALSGVWEADNRRGTSLMITTAGFRPVSNNFRLTISPYKVNSASPLAGVKSCNYLDKIMTIDEAKSRGFDEAVCLNEREEIVSACMANIFWLKDNKLFTPGLGTGCLAGTTREYVLDNLECKEIEAGLNVLAVADSIFITSAGIGVVQVTEFDGRQLKIDPHEILKLHNPTTKKL